MSVRIILQRKMHERIRVRIQRRALITERYVARLNSSVLQIDDDEFRRCFGINRLLFSIIMEDVVHLLKKGTGRRAITPEMKVLITLRFLAQGSYQRGVGNDRYLSVAQPTVSVILNEVIDIFNKYLCPKYIKISSEDEMKESALFFQKKYQIPGIFGAINCTHVRITTPTKNEFIYVNRKNYHSINTQLICDHNYRILNVNAKFPGSTHDSYVWRQSAAREYISEQLRGKNYWLLGDSGYPLEPWLIVPFKDAVEESKILFNHYHAMCRSVIERCNGIIKARWRCLKDNRGLHYSPEVAGRIINSCVALHNLCINYMKDYPLVQNNDDDEVPHIAPSSDSQDCYRAGAEIREQLIAHIL